MARKKEIPAPTPYNPLEKKHLAENVANALLESEVFPLPPEPFIGAGVYALYYVGNFPAYAALANINKNGQFLCPIYVGKADPKGARKGGYGDVNPGRALYSRLKKHAASVTAATNLDLKDFYCRYLSVDNTFIPLAEAMLIERFKPVWNRVLDGFGNHDPGSGRNSGKLPYWDCLHPGRAWGKNLKPCAKTAGELFDEVKTYLEDALL